MVNISKVCDGTGAAGYAQNAAGYAQNAAGYATDAAGYAQFCQIIIPLRGPSCKLRLSRFSAKLKFQDGPSVAINIFVHEGKVCLQDRCADMEKVDYPRIISS